MKHGLYLSFSCWFALGADDSWLSVGKSFSSRALSTSKEPEQQRQHDKERRPSAKDFFNAPCEGNDEEGRDDQPARKRQHSPEDGSAKRKKKKREKNPPKKGHKSSKKEKRQRHTKKKAAKKGKNKKKSKRSSGSSGSSESSSDSSEEELAFFVEDFDGNANLPFMDIRVDVPAYRKPRRAHSRQPIGFTLLSPYEKTLALLSSTSKDKNDGRYFAPAVFRYMNDGSMRRLRMAYSERRRHREEETVKENGQDKNSTVVDMSKPQSFIPLRPVVKDEKAAGEWRDLEWDPESDRDSEGDEEENPFAYTPGLNATHSKNKLRQAQSLATESESVESMLTRRTRELNEMAIQNPSDIRCWLSLAAFQEEVLRHHPNRQTAKVVAQKQVAIFDRGLRSIPGNVILLQGRLAAASLSETPDALGIMWESTLRENGTDLQLWTQWMQFQHKVNQQALSEAYSVDSRRETTFSGFDGMYEALAARNTSSSSSNDPVERRPMLNLNDQYQALGLVRKACALDVGAGFTERAIAILQALIEFNMGRPRSVPTDGLMSKETMSAFELYWESEYARLGERGPPRSGWSAWYSETLVGKRILAAWDDSNAQRQDSDHLREIATTQMRFSVLQPILENLQRQLKTLDTAPTPKSTTSGQWHAVVDDESRAVNTTSRTFEDWCASQIQNIAGRDVNHDDASLVQFCMTINDPEEVWENFKDHFGTTRAVTQFAADFFQRRKGGSTKEERGALDGRHASDSSDSDRVKVESVASSSSTSAGGRCVTFSPQARRNEPSDSAMLEPLECRNDDDDDAEVKKDEKKSSSFHKKAKKAKQKAKELAQLGQPDPLKTEVDSGPRTFYSIVHGYHIELEDDSTTQEMYDKILNELATGESALDSDSKRRKVSKTREGSGNVGGSDSEEDVGESIGDGTQVDGDDRFTSWLSTEDHLSRTQWKPLKMVGDDDSGENGERCGLYSDAWMASFPFWNGVSLCLSSCSFHILFFRYRP